MSYEISVVIPYHNVRPEVFRVGFESLKNQTLGFDRIECIIVFHNCDQASLNGAMEIIQGYDNVRTSILNNDVHTPSSPRNHGMKMATAKYLGFLDGDDSYTPWCLEEALRHMKSSGAEITWFRREYELEDSNTFPMTEIVLWDQTREEIIIDRDRNWDNEKIFSGVWGLVTSRIYNRAFLLEHQVWFDDEANFAEDYLFNLEAYGHVKRLCYLPQMIGYHYFINSGSLVQKAEKDPAMLIQMAIGFTHIFDTGFKYGFYMDAIMGGMFFTQMRFMMGTRSLTLADRVRIKEILEPYLNRMKPIPVSKLYSEKGVYDRYYTVRDYLLNPEKWANGDPSDLMVSEYDRGIQLPSEMAVLYKILEKNSHTDMGTRYHFSDIVTISGYQSMVPLSNQQIYAPLMALTTRIGESGIFCSDPVICYLRAYDTAGNLLMFPATKDHLNTYLKGFGEVFRGHRSFLLFEGLQREIHHNDNTVSRTVYAAVAEAYRNSRLRDKSGELISPPEELLSDLQQGYYIRVLCALADEKLTQLIAPNTWSVFRMLDYIRRNRETLLADLRQGTISTPGMKKQAPGLTALRPNPARADALQKILDGDDPALQDIWPEMTCVTAFDAREYRLYTEALKKRMPGGKIRFRALQAIPEAMLGLPCEEDGVFALNTEGGFYEFRELSPDHGEDAFLLSRDLEEGKTYRLYVTNQAGLYRYETEQYLRIVRREGDSIFYTPCAGKEQGLPLPGGLLLEEETLQRALTGIPAWHDYADYAAWVEEDRLIVSLEPRDIMILADRDADTLSGSLESALCACWPEYTELRKAGEIQSLHVRLINPETMFLYAEMKSKKGDGEAEQVPPLHFIRQEKDQALFRTMAR